MRSFCWTAMLCLFLLRAAYGQIDESFPYLEKALALKPGDVNTQGILVATLSRSLSMQKEDTKLLAEMERLNLAYPALQTNNNFNSLLAKSFLIRSYLSYGDKKVADGDAYRVRFESIMDKNTGLKIDSNLISEAYSSAAVYYFRLGQTSKARKIVNKGLKYAPGNYELNTRKNMMK